MDNTPPDHADRVGISRRRAFALATKLGVGSAALGSGLSTALAADTPPSGGLPKKSYKFFFVCHVTLDQFFTPTIYGIQDACATLGCQYQWTGSQKNVVSGMVNAVQTAVAEKADGIAVCLVDPKAFDAAGRIATDAGIPLIAFKAEGASGSPNRRLAYGGQAFCHVGCKGAFKWRASVEEGGRV